MKRYRSALVLLAALALLVGGYFMVERAQREEEQRELAAQAEATPDPDSVRLVDRLSEDIETLTISRPGADFVVTRTVVYTMPEPTPMPGDAVAPGAGGAPGAADAPATGETPPEPEPTPMMEVVWGVDGMEGRKLTSSRLNSAASSFCSMTTQRVVLEGVPEAEMAQFGLGGADLSDTVAATDAAATADLAAAATASADLAAANSSSASVVGAFADGEVIAIEVGSANPTNDGYYVRMQGGSTVYLASKYAVENILFELEDILDKVIFEIAEEDIAYIEMDRGGENLFCAKVADNGYEFDVFRPIEGKLGLDIQSQISEAVGYLTAQSVDVADASDEELAEYGLDNPRYRLAIEDARGVARALAFGKEKAGGAAAYCMVEGARDVFSVSLDQFGFLDKPMREIVEAFAYIVNISSVERISAAFDGRVVEISIETDEEDRSNDLFVVDGVDVSKLEDDRGGSYFRKFYQAMIGVTLYDVESDASPPPVPAEITFAYTLREEPGEMVVEYVPKDDRLYYVMRNGQYAGITVEKSKFDAQDGLRQAYAALTAAAANNTN